MKDKKKLKESLPGWIIVISIFGTFVLILSAGIYFGDKVSEDIATYDVCVGQEMRIYDNNINREGLRLPVSVYVVNETEEYIAISSKEVGTECFGYLNRFTTYSINVKEGKDDSYIVLENKHEGMIYAAFIIGSLIAAVIGVAIVGFILMKIFPNEF